MHGKQKRATSWRVLLFDSLARGLLRARELALVAGSRVAVDQPLPRGAIEHRGRGNARFGRRIGFTRLLERGPDRRALGAIADRGGAGLPHGLLGGLQIRHWDSLVEMDPRRCARHET